MCQRLIHLLLQRYKDIIIGVNTICYLIVWPGRWVGCSVFSNTNQCFTLLSGSIEMWMPVKNQIIPYNITAPIIDQAFGSHQEFWVTPGQQMMVKCGDWGCGPNQDWSHINVKPMQGVWQPSYAVDVHMDATLQHYSPSCWPGFWESSRILGNSLATNDGKVQWLRLWTQSRFISHQYQTNARCLTTLICSGCAHGFVFTTLRPLTFTKLLEVI